MGQVDDLGLWRDTRDDAFHGADEPVAGAKIVVNVMTLTPHKVP